MAIDFLGNGPSHAPETLVLAHGAGAPMDSEFLGFVSEALAARGVHVLRFEFPYMRARRESGKPRPPDREAVLLETWRQAIRECGVESPFIGGKSLGGRMASMVADEMGAAGLICLGYPFHPPGKPERTRTAHLEGLRTPTLIVQGTRDPFGNREDVAGYALSTAIQVRWIEGGNHDLQVPGRAKAETWSETVEAVGAFGRG
ncbi:MAG: alpha/beta hydrolase [Dehalococcoidia bacterium]|nr:alpha/beta hydrolase [Dehalococcoidia bacterium]